MSYAFGRADSLPVAGAIIRDVRGLVLVQTLLLCLTYWLTPSDVGDLRVQFVWFLCLIPGWILSAYWTASHVDLVTRYAHAVIGAIAIHGCLASVGNLLGFEFRDYYLMFAGLTLALGFDWSRRLLPRRVPQRVGLSWSDGVVWIAIMLLVIAMYRQPRSNDTIQFLLQQQDMAFAGSLQPSSIGMAALDVERAMPRWRAYLWHLVPSLIADLAELPVDGVVGRWAPIPIAFSVIVVLVRVVSQLAGRRIPLWAVALAIFGPVVLWYRSYHAFNYSFRLSNSFCLDKDLCLFLLIPAVVYLVVRWIRGRSLTALPLCLLVPAILKFHPMTMVYLTLLLPFVVIGFDRRIIAISSQSGLWSQTWKSRIIHDALPSPRAIFMIGSCLVLFVVSLVIGDAQTAHRQIAGIMEIDWRDHQAGRPLHYWVGQYAPIPDHDLELDTCTWVDDRLTLRTQLLWNCELLGAMHLAFLVILLGVSRSKRRCDFQRLLAIASVLAMLWGMWWVSPWFLTRNPHLLAGYERLHWFAYLPGLVTIAISVFMIADGIVRWIESKTGLAEEKYGRIVTRFPQLASVLVGCLLAYSALSFRIQRETIWTHVRVLNSLLDFELPAQIERERAHDSNAVDRTLKSMKPEYLNANDRVLFLDNRGNDQYWLIKQGVYWSEPYAEAYAWQDHGDVFLQDRRHFYALLDRIPIEGVAAWLDSRRVTLVVDRRAGADEYLSRLNQQQSLGMTRIAPGVWRRDS